VVKIFYTVVSVCGLACFFLVGCATTANRVMPGYDRMNVSGSTLGVVLVRKNIQVLNAQDVAQDIGSGVPEDAYYAFFGAEFPAEMKACSKFAEVYFVRHGDEMFGNSGAAVDFGVHATLPSRKGCISDTLDYLLIIDYLTTGHERNTSMRVGGGSDGNFGGFFSGSESLTHSADFVLWDNREGTIAVYGGIRERTRLYDQLTREVWVAMLQKMAYAVTRRMPYRR
jgi:hypothetical protein